MEGLVALVGVAIIAIVLADAVSLVLIPRTVRRPQRISSVSFTLAGRALARLVKVSRLPAVRSVLLGAFGPVSILLIIVTWAMLLVLGFGMLDWAVMHQQANARTLGDSLYFSGVTFFTLGYGDITPETGLARTLSVVQAGIGFMFLAVIIGYVPVFYSLFSRREALILMMDTRAGSEPTGLELLRRYALARCVPELPAFLKEWERWSAEQMEAFLSYPPIVHYRSQHDHQSWINSLVAVMDACAILRADPGWPDASTDHLRFQTRATFGMGRHFIVDCAYVLSLPPSLVGPKRMTPSDAERLVTTLREMGASPDDGFLDRLAAQAHAYEPYAISLARSLIMTMPSWVPREDAVDNWMVSYWEGERHF